MKVSLEKELEKSSIKQKGIFESDPVNEVKLLLSGESLEDVRILRGLSNNSQFNRIERIRGEQIELEKFENEYGGKVYKIDQIRDLAIDYHLRFLSSQLYTGTFDIEVTAKIKEFARLGKFDVSQNTLERSFFILAPEEMFQLKEEKHVTYKKLDPMIFYKIDNEHYRLIHKWGNDFTIFRLLDGFRYKSWWKHLLFNTVMVLPIFTFIMGFIYKSDNVINHPFLFILLSILVSTVFSFFMWGWSKFNDDGVIEGYFSPTNWNSNVKIVGSEIRYR